jgi:heptosyltransferase-2
MGARKDCPIAAEMAAQIPWAENKTGQTTLAEVMAEIARSRLILCNDSGAMHLSAALGIATAAIFGSTEPKRTGPLGQRAVALRRHVPCSPCFLRDCPIDFACMNSLTPDLAWPECRRLWDSAATTHS